MDLGRRPSRSPQHSASDQHTPKASQGPLIDYWGNSPPEEDKVTHRRILETRTAHQKQSNKLATCWTIFQSKPAYAIIGRT